LKTVGDHIRARRLDLGLTQAEAASYIGVSEAAVYEWEKYDRSPSIRHWPGILSFLGYDPHPEPKTTADKLRALRRREGWSQQKLALHLGVDEGTVRKWEQGQEPERRGLRMRVEDLIAEYASIILHCTLDPGEDHVFLPTGQRAQLVSAGRLSPRGQSQRGQGS
jgi:DNA-binding transcriptional regulator YiaG